MAQIPDLDNDQKSNSLLLKPSGCLYVTFYNYSSPDKVENFALITETLTNIVRVI